MEIVTMLVELGFTPLNILLVVMLYFVLAKQGVVPKLWKTEDTDDVPKPEWVSLLLRQQKDLLQYVNHAQTDKIDKSNEILERVEENTEKTLEVVKSIQQRHTEYDKFGIKCLPVQDNARATM